MSQLDFAEPARLDAGLIKAARERARTSGQLLLEVLEETSGLEPTSFVRSLGATFAYPVMDMASLAALTPCFEQLTFAESAQKNCVLVKAEEGLLAVLADPFDTDLQSWLESRCTLAPQWRLAHAADLLAFFAIHERELRALDGMTQIDSDAVEAVSAEDLSFASITGDSSPIIRLVNSTVYDAMKVGASDIHFETTKAGLQVKYRIDGVLALITEAAGLAVAEQVISRIKVMAELDIAERRIPQDGRFRLVFRGEEIDYRVSVMPNLVCEDVVIRILDKRGLTDEVVGLTLDPLGFDANTLHEIRRLARKPYGMLLVTGPTGSGKTTTMYAALSEINDGRDKIITIEDPIEYQLPGVLQIPVNEKKGLTFARGLRSILRHDPDKILVGEIRDPETAQIAIQSALTGHLVLTSVHANNVFDVLGRFLHMGVDTYSFVSALNGIVGQRLLRLICSNCAADYLPDEEELEYSEISPERSADIRWRHGTGCGHCRGTGYKGRHAVGEVLRLTDEMRELIVARAPISIIKQAALKGGTRFLREAAVDLAVEGRTTLEEINRVTFAS
ncbi:type II/IV secretion system protein [Rugamonas sp. FT82W]|uniref:Type II/IV secretion system protein n=1 Tax=Duganella vulcania TaxID=2692166 RepID=A0A845GAA2_9BURK|nr:GspE/PulE family protein [Duganella vulcania]MYM90382.1 type II/IV secretion system protein [Duganella vulcania]